MPLCVSYVKLTEEGTEHLKKSGEDVAQVSRWIQEVGGRVIGAYATTGRFDYLYITEFPDNKVGWGVLAKVAMLGHTSSETNEIIPIEEWLQVVAKA